MSYYWLTKSQEKHVQDTGRGRQREGGQEEGTEGARGVWGGRMWAGDFGQLLPPKRAGIKSCMVVPEPKWSHSRCSVNILRVNINRGDDSGSCSPWEIFYHVYKSCFCAYFGYKVRFLEITFALWCPLVVCFHVIYLKFTSLVWRTWKSESAHMRLNHIYSN